MSAKKHAALRRLRGLIGGETVYTLCAKIDPSYSQNPNSRVDGEPATDPSSFTWYRATVVKVEESGEVEIVYEDGSVTAYERRFLFAYDEAVALKLPTVPKP